MSTGGLALFLGGYDLVWSDLVRDHEIIQLSCWSHTSRGVLLSCLLAGRGPPSPQIVCSKPPMKQSSGIGDRWVRDPTTGKRAKGSKGRRKAIVESRQGRGEAGAKKKESLVSFHSTSVNKNTDLTTQQDALVPKSSDRDMDD